MKFLVGPEKIEYSLHKALLEYHSGVAERAINGTWSEAKDGAIPIEQFDEATVARFIHYAYKGDYTPADFIFEQNDCGTSTSSCSPRPISASSKWNQFKAMPDMQLNLPFKPRENTSAKEDYAPVFLSHAELYAFADMHQIKSLSKLCLQKLHRTLCEYKVYDNRTSDIVSLLIYAYENTAARPGGTEKLRELVSKYAACIIEILGVDPGFQDLLCKNGELGKDIIAEVVGFVR